MNNIKPYLRKIIYTVPGAQALWIGLNKFLDRGGGPRPEFSGWGMVTHTFTPWHSGGDKVARDFSIANQEIVTKVKERKFNLSQFKDVQDKRKLLYELMWRHYIVFWSARYASKSTNCSVKNLVECGVCDGLTVYFAMNALKGMYEFKSFLYDAWEGMKSEYLLESEKGSVGDYSYLAIENTKKNLAAFQEETVFNKGYIPGSFEASDNPTEIAWLHIDLNSSLPTTAALQFFFEKMPPGGVILFDDYAWRGYYDTKLAVDKFFSGKNGVLLPLPTGQAIFFKH
jgi:O-methyltransferase